LKETGDTRGGGTGEREKKAYAFWDSVVTEKQERTNFHFVCKKRDQSRKRSYHEKRDELIENEVNRQRRGNPSRDLGRDCQEEASLKIRWVEKKGRRAGKNS